MIAISSNPASGLQHSRSESVDLTATVAALMTNGKGILAVDESHATLEKRFVALKIPFNEQTRSRYREWLLTTPSLEESISGVILFDETLRQSGPDHRSLPRLLSKRGILPGIKVDRGTVALALCPGGKITEGLDGLRDRLEGYRALGARFTKWRAVLRVEEALRHDNSIQSNAEALARFAALSQEAGLVPLVEPEILMEGDHDLGTCETGMRFVLEMVFQALVRHGVVLEQMLLKTGMVLPGDRCTTQVAASELAEATRRCLSRAVPCAVPGIVFLSGGQSSEKAVEHLRAICSSLRSTQKFGFSFGRALQSDAMRVWGGKEDNVEAARQVLLERVRAASLALETRPH